MHLNEILAKKQQPILGVNAFTAGRKARCLWTCSTDAVIRLMRSEKSSIED